MQHKNLTALALAAGVFQHAALNDGSVTSGTDTGNAAANKNKKPEAPPAPEGMKNQVFHFRKEKITSKNEAGEDVVIETFKHPSVVMPLPTVTREEVATIFNAPVTGDGNRASEQAWILSLIEDAIYVQARDQINEHRENTPKANVTADILDYNKLTITALANMPASERGTKIDEEELEDFLKDYAAVMSVTTGKEPKKIAAQVGVLERMLRPVKTDKVALDAMAKLLTVWAGATTAMDEHSRVYEYLKNRAEKWLKAEPKNILADIM